MSETKFDELVKDSIHTLNNSMNDVLVQAVTAMCEHYHCTATDLVLERTHKPGHQILRKSTPGLAYLIRYEPSDDTWSAENAAVRVVAEPIYLEDAK